MRGDGYVNSLIQSLHHVYIYGNTMYSLPICDFYLLTNKTQVPLISWYAPHRQAGSVLPWSYCALPGARIVCGL